MAPATSPPPEPALAALVRDAVARAIAVVGLAVLSTRLAAATPRRVLETAVAR